MKQAGRNMKVNYISVIKEYVRKNKEERFVIRASMDIKSIASLVQAISVILDFFPRIIKVVS